MVIEQSDLIYEAAYIYYHYGVHSGNPHEAGQGPGCKSGPVGERELKQALGFKNQWAVTALWRIIAAAQIDSPQKAALFLEDYEQGSKGGKALAEKLYHALTTQGTTPFFTGLSEGELFVYHSANFDVSYEYGRNLASVIDFSGKAILDIGGSSGGLCAGIRSVYDTAGATVFDTLHGVNAAVDNRIPENYGISFISGDFMDGPIGVRDQAYDYVILSNVLHDWDNLNAIRILMNISPAISKKTKIIIHEDMLENDGLSPYETVLYGLRLCANVPGGQQRTRREIEALLKLSYRWYQGIDAVHLFLPHTAIVVSFI